MFVASSKKKEYQQMRDRGYTKQETREKLGLSRQTTKNYEDSYPSQSIKAVEGTTQALAETVTLPPSRWSVNTIMMYVGMAFAFILIMGLVIYGSYSLYHYFFTPDSEETGILDTTFERITKTAEERAKARYENENKQLKNENKQLKEDLEEIKRVCPTPPFPTDAPPLF